MEKENLIQFIYDYNKEIKQNIEITKKDIEYKKDVLEINKKHNKNTSEVLNEITELKTILQTLEQTQEIFNTNLEEQEIDIEEIEKYCED